MRNPKAERLLQRLQNGEATAMADLADAYGPKIHQLAFRYLRNKEDAEEVVQDVLYKVYRNVGEFRGEAALSSWIYRITFNAAMSRLRSASCAAVAEYLSARGGFFSRQFEATRFVLFSSRASTGGGPYIVEAAYPLC